MGWQDLCIFPVVGQDWFARRRAVPKLALGLLAGALTTSCGDPVRAPDPNPYSGEWLLSVSASAECLASLPYGYGVAPRGGGRIALTQEGDRLSGRVFIFDKPSGHLEGTITGEKVQFTITLDGRNVGVISPADEPCRVTGSAQGSISSCSLGAALSGELACPYSCTSTGHQILLTRCR